MKQYETEFKERGENRYSSDSGEERDCQTDNAHGSEEDFGPDA